MRSDDTLVRHRGRRRGRRRGSGCVAVVLALALLLGAGGFAVVQGRAWLEQLLAPPPDFKGPGRGSVLIEVHKGDTTTEIGETLQQRGVVASVEAFTDAARDEPRARLIQVGFYDMRRRMSAEAALDRMLDPKTMVDEPVTVPEGFTVEQTLDRIAEETDFSRKQLRAAAAQPARLGLPPYAGGELEGYLFPATYQITPGMNARELLTAMVDRFKEAARTVDLRQRAARSGRTPGEIVTIASIVQREVRHTADMPKVARVIVNRLDQGWQLEMDSTVHYATNNYDKVTTTPEDRRIDSPYNTYRRDGLPPGPIAAPGEAALKAALDPANGDWLYFVTVNLNTGRTKFAVTESQHERNRREYQRFCRTSELC